MTLFKKIMDNPGKAYVLASALLVSTLGPLTESGTRKLLVNEIERVIDYDGNGFADDLEWDSVYSRLGVANEGRIGQDLSVSQLQRYLKYPLRKEYRQVPQRPNHRTILIDTDDEVGEVF